ncbi:MAG: hypothetical protein WAU76_19300 [Candidatus Sulfotelmatobacter sp.]
MNFRNPYESTVEPFVSDDFWFDDQQDDDKADSPAETLQPRCWRCQQLFSDCKCGGME